MEPDRLKQLEFIQGIINRLAQTSFLVKGWSVTLVAALFALAAKDANLKYAILPYFPVAAFWLLDGYYLHQERLYRALYEDVVAGKVSTLSLNASAYDSGERTWWNTTWSKTLMIFHGTLFATVLVVMVILVGHA